MHPQAPFGSDEHDSLQVHFRCGSILGAARVFLTPTLHHASFWIFDGERLRRLHDSVGPLRQEGGSRLDVGDGAIRFRQEDEVATIVLGGLTVATWRPGREYRWGDTIATVIHQPDMACELLVDGRRLSGVGYCKRYAWTPAPRHWGYRFVQGWTDDGAAVWTADATFGREKYDYFRLLEPDGALHEARPDASLHRQDAALADLPQGPARASLRELAVWEAPLVSHGMDSLLRQRICRLTLETPGRRREGLAINETCYGTLG